MKEALVAFDVCEEPLSRTTCIARSSGDARLDLFGEGDEGDRVVAGDVTRPHLAGHDVHRSEKRRGAMSPVLELAPLGLAGTNRLRGMFAALGLDAGLLVDRQRDRILRRAQVEPADVRGTLPELGGVVPCQPTFDAMGFHVVGGENAPDLGGGDADPGIGHSPLKLGVAPLRVDVGMLLGDLGHEHETLGRP